MTNSIRAIFYRSVRSQPIASARVMEGLRLFLCRRISTRLGTDHTRRPRTIALRMRGYAHLTPLTLPRDRPCPALHTYLLLLDHSGGCLGVGPLRGEQPQPVMPRTSSWRSGASKADSLHVVADQETLSQTGFAHGCLQHRAEDSAAVAVARDGSLPPWRLAATACSLLYRAVDTLL
jgi:hypothetical protein